MSLTALLVAGMVLKQDSSGLAQHVARISGKDVKWTFQTAKPTPYSDEVLNWSGWGFLPPGPRAAPGAFRIYKLPSDIEDQYNLAAKNITETTPVWRIKVVVFRESDILDRDESGVLRRRFSTVEPYQVDDMMPALGRFAGLVQSVTGGTVRPQIDLEVDTEPQRFDPRAETPWGDEFAKRYFGPRVNGGGFESDDKVFRGPYSSVFYIHPGLTSGASTETWVNDAPIFGVSLAADGMVQSASTLDSALLLAWERQAYQLGLRRGAPTDYRPASKDWKILSGSADMDAEDQALLMVPRDGDRSVLQKLNGVYALSPNSENVTLSVAQDSDKGGVLSYSEAGLYRSGGAVVPRAGTTPAIALGETPFLSFMARSTSKDPIAVKLFATSSPPLEIVLGRDFPARDVTGGPRKTVNLAFRPDGTWQPVVIDLRAHLQSNSGLPVVTEMQIGPPTNSTRFSKVTVGKIEYQFSAFAASAEAPGPATTEAEPPVADISAPSEDSRALALARLKLESPKEDLEAAERLILDPSGFVRLNAISVFTRAKSPTAVVALVQATKTIDPRVGQAAVQALAFQDTEIAWQAVRNALVNGPFDANREEAARAIGGRRDPSTAGPLSTVIDSRSRLAKLAAIEAIGGLPGDKAPLIVLAFLNQDDPEIRLGATRAARAVRPEVLRQLLYSAVNDTSDQIRWESYRKLLAASNEEFRSEAFKGVRDDGVLVRLALIESFAESPSEEHRPALRLAVTDSAPRVRAAALGALGMLPKGVAPEEVENTFSEVNPLVQEALLDLAAKGSLKLPKETLDAMKSSSVPRIAARAKALG